MTCRHCRSLFVDALYDQLNEELRPQFDEHTASCANCTQLFAEMKDVLEVMRRRERPEPDSAYWATLKSRLSSPADKLPVKAKGARAINILVWYPSRIPLWAYAAAAVLLVAVGIYIGKMTISPTLHNNVTPQDKLALQPADTTNQRAMAYLDRSKTLLLGLLNSENGENRKSDYAHEQEISRQLITEANILKVALNRPDEQQLRKLVQDLEIVLLQLANVEVRPGVPAIEFIRQGVDQKSILLKINLEQMRASRRRPALPDRKSNSSL